MSAMNYRKAELISSSTFNDVRTYVMHLDNFGFKLKPPYLFAKTLD